MVYVAYFSTKWVITGAISKHSLRITTQIYRPVLMRNRRAVSRHESANLGEYSTFIHAMVCFLVKLNIRFVVFLNDLVRHLIDLCIHRPT